MNRSVQHGRLGQVQLRPNLIPAPRRLQHRWGAELS